MTNSSTKEGISFPTLLCWNPATKVVTMPVNVSEKRIFFNISSNDLRKKYHSFKDNPLRTVMDHRGDIETAARKLIEDDCYEPDRANSISYKDL